MQFLSGIVEELRAAVVPIFKKELQEKLAIQRDEIRLIIREELAAHRSREK